jgi:hypothetical protein
MRLNPELWKHLTLAPLVVAIACLSACSNKPTDAQLQAWREEAIARNAEMIATHKKKSPQNEWNIVIEGQTATGKPLQLNWEQLVGLAKTYVKTPDPSSVTNADEVFQFRGVPISTLLKQIVADSDIADDVTFVSFDSYQVTVSLKDLLTYPIILAIERNGKLIPRDQGGPLYLVFPYSQYPELKQKYDAGFWAFYVSHMIVGTEPVQLQVGKSQLNLADLDKLPQVTVSQPVGYRIGWPNGNVKLQGVRVRDVLALAGEKLPPQAEVVVRGKAAIYDDNNTPVRLAASDVRKCDTLLVTRWGDNNQLIPAKMGGPVTLAFGSNCPSQPRWVTFVEELSVRP